MLRVQTVEYAFDTRTALLAAATTLGTTVHTTNTITLDIPETSSRTFRSVMLIVNARDASATFNNMTGVRLGVQLGAAGATTADITGTLTQTGDHSSYPIQKDFTSYFNTNFGAGASQTCTATLSWSAASATSSWQNITFKL